MSRSSCCTPVLVLAVFLFSLLFEAPMSAAHSIPFRYGPVQARKLVALVIAQIPDEAVVQIAEAMREVAGMVEGSNPFTTEPRVVPPREHMLPPEVEEAAVACARAIEAGPAGRPLVSSPTDDADPYSAATKLLLDAETITDLQARWAEVYRQDWGVAERADLTATKDARKKALLGPGGGA